MTARPETPIQQATNAALEEAEASFKKNVDQIEINFQLATIRILANISLSLEDISREMFLRNHHSGYSG